MGDLSSSRMINRFGCVLNMRDSQTCAIGVVISLMPKRTVSYGLKVRGLSDLNRGNSALVFELRCLCPQGRM